MKPQPESTFLCFESVLKLYAQALDNPSFWHIETKVYKIDFYFILFYFIQYDTKWVFTEAWEQGHFLFFLQPHVFPPGEH